MKEHGDIFLRLISRKRRIRRIKKLAEKIGHRIDADHSSIIRDTLPIIDAIIISESPTPKTDEPQHR